MFCEKIFRGLITEGSEWEEVPCLANGFENAHDRIMHMVDDYLSEQFNNEPSTGDVAVSPVRCHQDVCTGSQWSKYNWSKYWILTHTPIFRIRMEESKIYGCLNKGIPLLHIWDVKPQYGLEDHVKYSWNLDKAAKECELEIDQSDKNEQGKKAVKFSLATNDIDKLVSHVVDGYEVKYMLRTDAIRLRLELEIASPPDAIPDFNSVHGEVKLEFEHDGKTYTIDLLCDNQHPSKKAKLDCSAATFKLSFIRIIPLYVSLLHLIKLTVALKDSTGILDVDDYIKFSPYRIPVDQQDYIPFKTGYIIYRVFWGCCLDKAKGFCTEVCTCEPDMDYEKTRAFGKYNIPFKGSSHTRVIELKACKVELFEVPKSFAIAY